MIFCTLFDSNYLDKGLVMYYSLAKVAKDFKLYILAMDDMCYKVLSELKYEHVIPISLEEFEDDELKKAKTSRTRAEYCWTCSSCLISFVLHKKNEISCTYLDSDLYFYKNPQVLIDEMGEQSVQIVEHRFLDTWEERLREKQAGKYCVEFNTFVKKDEALSLLDVWKGQCLNSCGILGEQKNVWGDQKYLDGWEKFSYVSILKNLGGGVAPWNIHQYTLVGDRYHNNDIVLKDKKTNEEFSLIFYHYHKIEYLSRNVVDINIYKNYWGADKNLVKRLYVPYLKELEKTKQYLEREFGIFSMLEKHPVEVIKQNKKQKKIYRERFIQRLFLKLNWMLRNICQSQNDIIEF